MPERFTAKLEELLDYHNFVLTKYLERRARRFGQRTRDEALAMASRLAPLVTDVPRALYEAHRAGKNLLFEGAQGTSARRRPRHLSVRHLAATALPAPRRPAPAWARRCCTTSSASPRRTRRASAPGHSRPSWRTTPASGCARAATSSARPPGVRAAAAGSMPRRSSARSRSTASRGCASPSSTCWTAWRS